MAETLLGALKKCPRATGRPLVILDESGFIQQPLLRRTWVPTPLVFAILLPRSATIPLD
jgi:hypothetical protein